ncbi:MAG: putative AlkP superfamily phosphohydrolase/phosphomutase [Chlamydiales bacterium]|jgi:predicted AlkP superfamily phosphohydrolase/phosphomutase
MSLPRWTTYPALGVLLVFFVSAIPHRRQSVYSSNAAAIAANASRSLPASTYPRVVVLGIDGLDPDILQEVMELYPERMPNFRKLIEQGDGIRSLGTSTPPQSPVAWSNFITGRNPGGHGIFDFIHRDPETYNLVPSTVTTGHSEPLNLPGEWQFPMDEGGDTNRTGTAFWTILRDAGVPADVWRMPINFPVEEAKGLSFPGMMTPAVDSAYGEFTFYTTDPPVDKARKTIPVVEREGVIRTSVLGPTNPFKESAPRVQVPLNIYLDHESGAAAIELGHEVLVMQPGQWSDFVPVTFGMLPMGMMDMSGIVRFYLRSIEPEFELYASPINVDPRNPISPVSYPDDASGMLADEIGNYYTQGMAEDVNGLKKRVLTDDEFMRQANLVYEERGRMLDYALERYVANEDGGLLFFYYSTVDLCGHMMWRHQDEEHPFHEADVAAGDSSWWTGRDDSTWKTVIHDLYLKMDPILGQVREAVGEDTLIFVMSDHGFAPYHRKFSLNTWLLENGYMVLKDGFEREMPADDPAHEKVMLVRAVDWSKTRAFGMGFNGLYLNLAGRESEGIVNAGAEADALIAELAQKLEAIKDSERDGTQVVLSADVATDVYTGTRVAEAPDILVGYNSGYGNSDEASLGQIPHAVLSDNLGGTFNGSHLMDPRVVAGTLLTNRGIALDDPRLEDLTVEVLGQYNIKPDAQMNGRPVLK